MITQLLEKLQCHLNLTYQMEINSLLLNFTNQLQAYTLILWQLTINNVSIEINFHFRLLSLR